jgi:uncharacterized protein (DUF2062 family)
MPNESLFKRIFAFIFAKLLKINSSAQKVALGFGLGVFSGILPGTGPLFAIFLAFVFKANRAAAVLASILTNTWFSIATFVLAIKVGSVILNLHWQKVQQKAGLLFKDASLAKFLKFSFFDVLLPIFIGYLAIGVILGLVSYLIILLIMRRYPHGNKTIHQ